MAGFHAEDWFEIESRGWVACIRGAEGLDPRTLIGREVEIDGARYEVHGVETPAVPDATGHDFGLLVGSRQP